MIGAALAPAAISGGAAALNGLRTAQNAYDAFLLSHPAASAATNLTANAIGVGQLMSNNGIRKTYGLFKDGDYKNAALSLAGDAFDVYGVSTLFRFPYRVYASGLSSGLKGTNQLFASNWSNTANAIKGFNPFLHDFLRTTPNLGERLRAIRNGYSSVLSDNFHFLSDMRKWNPLQNISLSLGTYNPASFNSRASQPYLSSFMQLNDIQNLKSLLDSRNAR